MTLDADDDKLLRLIKKIKAEEAQHLARCRRVEAILASRMKDLEVVSAKLENEKNDLKLIENEFASAVFAKGRAMGFEILSKRKLKIRSRVLELESSLSEIEESVAKAQQHRDMAQSELQGVISSRKTAEQMNDKRKMTQHLLMEQEEESRSEDVHGKRMDDLPGSRFRK